MRRVLLPIVLFFLLILPSQAQQEIYLPVIFKGNMPILPDPILRLRSSNGIIVNLIGTTWKLADPNWNPQVARIKGGGAKVNSALAPGRRLTNHEYDNVVETIPLSLRGLDQDKAMQSAHEMLELLDQASNYWDRPYELDSVWLEARLPCSSCFTAYSRVIIGSIPELSNPFGQPFFSDMNPGAVMEDITLIIEREPFWRATEPGTIIGPLFNLIDNPDFEIWNFGTADSQPDSWTDLESLHITGTNNRQQTGVRFGESILRIRVSGSTLTGAVKGITQVINDVEDGTQYTVIAWARNDGISNGVGRILITYASQLELYRESNNHGWTLYTGKITTGISDTVAISVEILTTAANTDGTFYIDGLMFIKGDFEQEAKDNVLPYISGSHIVNHWDQPSGIIEAGDINYLDAWNVPGTVDSLVRLEVKNNSGLGNDFAEMFIGMRRTGNIFQFDNYSDIVGGADITASSDDFHLITPTSEVFKLANSELIIGALNTRENIGRYRLLVRMKDAKATGGASSLQARVRYFSALPGIRDKIIDVVNISNQGDWVLNDLTPSAAIIFGNKFDADDLTQMGYQIEIKRNNTDIDDVRFDYSMLMPTDGGFIRVILEPSLIDGSTLLADNTKDSITVAISQQQDANWTVFFEETDSGTFDEFHNHVLILNGFLYFTANNKLSGAGVDPDFRIYKSNFGDTTPESNVNYIAASSNIQGAIIEYNGFIYYLPDGLSLLKLNADTMTLIDEITVPVLQAGAVATLYNMVVYNNKIYFAGTEVQFAPIDTVGLIYEYDGTTAVVQREFTVGSAERRVEVYADRLYVSQIGTNIIDIFNRVDNTWTTTTVTGATTVRRMETFRDILFVATDVGIIAFGGDDWTNVLAGNFISGFFAISNDRLFISDTTLGIFFTENGTDWTKLPGLDTVVAVGSYNNLLIGVSGLKMYFANIVGGQQSASDFSGTTFHSPPRTRTNEKRHRFFVSFNRANTVNNLDDKALIGVGFVPQYLTIRGRN